MGAGICFAFEVAETLLDTASLTLRIILIRSSLAEYALKTSKRALMNQEPVSRFLQASSPGNVEYDIRMLAWSGAAVSLINSSVEFTTGSSSADESLPASFEWSVTSKLFSLALSISVSSFEGATSLTTLQAWIKNNLGMSTSSGFFAHIKSGSNNSDKGSNSPSDAYILPEMPWLSRHTMTQSVAEWSLAAISFIASFICTAVAFFINLIVKFNWENKSFKFFASMSVPVLTERSPRNSLLFTIKQIPCGLWLMEYATLVFETFWGVSSLAGLTLGLSVVSRINEVKAECYNLSTNHTKQLHYYWCNYFHISWSDPSLLLAFRFLLSSFVGALYRPPWPFLNRTH